MDLTKIDVPFGELDDETAAALFLHWRRGGAIKAKLGQLDSGTAIAGNPAWTRTGIYCAVPTKPSIDWSHVSDQFNWLAIDRSGQAWLYTSKPNQKDARWAAVGGFAIQAAFFTSYIPGTCDWRDSLICRPGVEGEE